MPFKNDEVNREYQREYQRKWMKKRRDKWVAENGPCAKCSSSENLEIDHIDPSTKRCPVATLWSRREEVRNVELTKCQVLCKQCHNEKSYGAARAALKHGTASMYVNRSCRCALCRNWKAAYRKGRRHMGRSA